VLADADMPKCVATVAAGIFSNSGQLCIAGSRILVQRQVYDQFLEAFVAESKKWVVGDPM